MRKAVVVAAGVFMVAGFAATAQQSEIVRQRQALMKSNQEQLRSLGGMARGQAPFNAAAAQTALQTLERNALQIPPLFPPNSFTGETNALPVIAERKADFDGRATKLAQDARAATAGVRDQASLQTALQAVGQSCNGCHETYRKRMQ